MSRAEDMGGSMWQSVSDQMHRIMRDAGLTADERMHCQACFMSGLLGAIAAEIGKDRTIELGTALLAMIGEMNIGPKGKLN